MTTLMVPDVGPGEPAVAGEISGAELAGGVRQLHQLLDTLTSQRRVDAAASDEQLRTVHADLARAKARIDAVAMIIARDLHERGAARAAGAVSTGQLLAADFGGDRSDANRSVRTAADLANAPAVENALAAGVIDRAQAGLIAGALRKLPTGVGREERDTATQSLLAAAATLGIEDLGRAARHAAEAFKTRAEADRHEEGQLLRRERRARRESSFWMANNRDGTWRGGFVLPDAEAEMIRAAVEAHAAPRRYHLDHPARDTADDLDHSRTPDTADDLARGTVTSGADWLPMDKRHREGRAFATICARLPADRLPTAGGRVRGAHRERRLRHPHRSARPRDVALGRPHLGLVRPRTGLRRRHPPSGAGWPVVAVGPGADPAPVHRDPTPRTGAPGPRLHLPRLRPSRRLDRSPPLGGKVDAGRPSGGARSHRPR